MRNWAMCAAVTVLVALGSGVAYALTGSADSGAGALETVSPSLDTVSAVTERSLLATFSEAMRAPGVTTPGHYAVSGPGVGTLDAQPNGVSTTGPYTLLWVSGREMRNGVAFTLTAAGLQDLVGNPIDPVRSSASGTGLGIPPLFSNLHANPAQAAVGDAVTLTFTASEDLQADPAVTVNGRDAVWVSGHGPADFVYTYVVQSGDPFGMATVSVSGVDAAGNPGSFSDDAMLTIIEQQLNLPLRAWPEITAMALVASAVLMRRRLGVPSLVAALLISTSALAAGPSVPIVTFAQSPNAAGSQVDIFYDLIAPNGPCGIKLSLSKDGGADGFPYPITHCAGDISGVKTGAGNHIVWDIRADYPEENIPQARIRVTADDAVPPPSLAYSWTRTWSGGYSNADRVAVDTAGNVYVAGDYSGTVDFDPDPVKVDSHTSANGSIDAYLSKFDASGNLLWVKTWGGGSGRDVAYGVAVDSAGNAYIVGAYRYTVDFDPDPLIEEIHTSNFPGENNIYLSKFASDGTFQWVRTWGPAAVPGKASFGGEAYTVVVAGNYLYIVGDFSGDQTDFNPWGSHDWHTNHPPASGTIQWFDAFLSKFDLDGNFQWAKTWGGEGYDDGPGVAVDSNGNVYVAGMYASQTINFDPDGGSGGLGHPAHDSGSVVDVFLSKFDAGGKFQWVKTWGGQGSEDATGLVVVDALNNVYVAGRFTSLNCDFNPGGVPDIHSANGLMDAFLSKFDPNGAFLWAKTWGGSGYDDARGLAVDRACNVYVTGVFSDTVDMDPGSGTDNHASNQLEDVYFSKFDSRGNYQWAKTWGGSGDDSGGIALDASNNAYAYGNFIGMVDFDPGSGVDNHTADGASGAYLIKFLSVGG